MLELKKLSIHDGRDIYEMLQEIPGEENGLLNKANGLTFEEYKEWLVEKQRDSEQEGLVDGWKVPYTTFWLYDDDVPVGFGSVRHFLTEALSKIGGHIGYGIVPQFRGKGYGKEILRLLLEQAQEIGIEKALVTIRLDNDASKAVALANGGVITDTTDERVLIWIDTFKKITLCGDNCIACPRYNAHSDEELKAVAELWHKVGWRNCVVSNEEIACDGCSSHKNCTYQLVECTKKHHVNKCNQCEEFPCEKITDMLKRSAEY